MVILPCSHLRDVVSTYQLVVQVSQNYSSIRKVQTHKCVCLLGTEEYLIPFNNAFYFPIVFSVMQL